MRSVTILLLVLLNVGALAADTPTIFEAKKDLATSSPIDPLVQARLKELGIAPARPCSDAVFLRRVYLDVIGALPTADEARKFLNDTSADKRARLIDELLEREEFADYWAMRWGDWLRVKSEFPINLWPNAVQAYHQWLRESIRANMPFDQFARELLTSTGSNFRVPPVNFYRALQGREPSSVAAAVAVAFMGDRMGHWPQDRRDGLAAFFSRIGYKSTLEWKEEIVFFDRSKPHLPKAMLPDGTTVTLPEDQDGRVVFADWLLRPGNPWFARAAVNRIWFHLLGRGLIHEVDDIRPDNPASHPQLLALLEKEFAASKYDVKHIFRLILNSATYQRSSVPAADDPKAAQYFACYPLRRLDAELLIDALNKVTGTTEEYSSPIPEPFSWIPTDIRAAALPDGSITSSFLELFGRPSRDTGLSDERNYSIGAAQRLHLLNSEHVRRKIETGPTLRALQRMINREPGRAVTEMYLTVLSRYPTAEELATIKTFGDAQRSVRGANVLGDVMWALINSPEFLYRH